MAYIGFEDIPARTINNRIVPTLRKYYRADGSFDLFDIYNKQQNCIKFLTDRGEAALYAADRQGDFSLGTYNTTITWGSNSNTFNQINMYRYSGYSYNARCRCAFRLQLDNVAGLFPYIVYFRAYSDHNASSRYVEAIRSNGASITLAGGGGNGTVTWSPEFGNATQMIDWKDYQQIYGYADAVDTSKYVRAETWINVSFIHRFSADHPLYRFYR